MALLLFSEDSSGSRQSQLCPDIPEAPLTSLLHHHFKLASLAVRKSPGRAEFVHPGGEVLVAVSLTHAGTEATIEFDIRESEIRSYEIFKPIRFERIPIATLRKGCAVGLMNRGAEVSCNFSAEEMEAILHG